MGIMVYSLLWVMQDFVHQPYVDETATSWAKPITAKDQEAEVL